MMSEDNEHSESRSGGRAAAPCSAMSGGGELR